MKIKSIKYLLYTISLLIEQKNKKEEIDMDNWRKRKGINTYISSSFFYCNFSFWISPMVEKLKINEEEENYNQVKTLFSVKRDSKRAGILVKVAVKMD